MRRLFFSLIFSFCLLLMTVSCQQKKGNKTVHLAGATMGTTWSVALHSAPDGTNSTELTQQLQLRLDQINRLMSTYDPTSEISRFNQQQSTDWFAISAETAQVIALSQEISSLTGGAFDISVGPLVELWGFGVQQRSAHIPTEEQIQEQLAQVGFQKLQLRQEPAALKKLQPQLQIDLSAVAKGYAVDLLAEILKQQGISNFLVEIGGELQIAGHRNNGSPWRIAIEKPLEGLREVEKILPLTGTALATSGNYRNFYVENGQRYAHTINPLSGRPIRHKLASVTVLDKDCARADALATALMVLGEEQGRLLVDEQGIAAYFLIHENEATLEYTSPAFQLFLEKVKK